MVRILDEVGLLACAMYIDLNPIRARLAETPETSCFTSVYVRLEALKAQKESRGAQSENSNQEQSEMTVQELDSWLSPVELIDDDEANSDPPTRRASNRGYLPLSFSDYLNLLDWTGREIRSDKRGSIPRIWLRSLSDCGSMENFG